MQVSDIYTPTASLVKTKRSLVLAGGGVRMSYQAGVLQALLESGLKFDHIDGTSGGIFNTAMVASGLSPYEMAERWRRLKVKDFISTTPFSNYLKLNKMVAFGDADGIRNKVFPALGIDVNKIRNNQSITATFNVCNFSRKTIESIPNHEVTTEHLLAGVSLPIFMPALEIDNQWYTDAVWIKDANLMEAVRKGAEEIWLVWAIGNSKEYLPGSFNQYVHMIEMSANGALLEEYEQIKLINSSILAGYSPFGQKRPIKLHIIKPEYPLQLDPDLFLHKINAGTLINMGYADAKRYLKNTSAESVAMDFQASQMMESGTTFSFRHQFKGLVRYKNKPVKAAYFPSFYYRKTGNSYSLSYFSSIYLEPFEKEISTYENEVRVNSNGKKALELFCKFLHLDNIYLVHATIELNSPIDFVLGFEFKSLKMEITEEDTKATILKGYLYQSAGRRFKSILHSKVDFYNEKGSGLRGKLNMINKLYIHEI